MSKGRHGNPLARGQEEKFVPPLDGPPGHGPLEKDKLDAGMIRNRTRGTRWFRDASQLRRDSDLIYRSISQYLQTAGTLLIVRSFVISYLIYIDLLLLLLCPSVPSISLSISPSIH